MNKNTNSRNTIHIQEGPRAFLKIVEQCGNRRNDGMICYGHGHIWLKNNQASPRYLIREIREAGGDFTGPGFIPLPNPDFNNPCTGGPNYEGGRLFESLENAIRYLKRHFTVLACDANSEWTQMKIDEV
jgi:hypothetical protein